MPEEREAMRQQVSRGLAIIDSRQQVTRGLAMIDSLSRRFGPQHLEGLEAPRAIAASQHEAMHGSGGPAQGES